MDNNTLKVLLKDKIKLEPKYLTSKYYIEILKRLKEKLEGKCSKHGYIKTDSIEIHKILPGVIELSSLSGMTIYDIYFNAELCNPVIGNIVKGVVKNTNRFGILVESPPVMDIIIAKNSVNIQSDINLEDIKIDQELTIEIMGKKYELGDKRISVIGRVVKEAKIPEKAQSSSILLDVNSEDDEVESFNEESNDDEESIDESINEEEEEDIEADDVIDKEGGEFDIFNDDDGGGDDYEIFASEDEGEYENDD